MFKNYLKTAFRNLIKYKGYSFINISGLALGIACCLLIMLYVKDELTFDRFHENGENIFRVRESNEIGSFEMSDFVNMPVGPTMKEELTEVVNQSRYVKRGLELRLGKVIHNQSKVFYVEHEFLEMFSFPAKYGDPVSVLKSDSEIVLVEKVARKIFGNKMALGESLDLNVRGQWKTFVVGAVLEDVPSNSSIDFEVLVPFQTYLTAYNRKSNNPKDWLLREFTFQTFLEVTPSTDINNLTTRMTAIGHRKLGELSHVLESYNLQPIKDLHFGQSEFSGPQLGMKAKGNKTYSVVLSGIAILILLLAYINFTNLSLARALPRAKEVGIRKVIGANRKQLVAQFLGEAFLIGTAAFFFGLLIAELSLPAFELAAQKDFTVTILDCPLFVLIAFLGVLISAFVAGAYPAFVISRFKTVSALKGNFDGVSRKGGLQKVLIVAQFALSAVLIIGVLMMNRQINFLVNLDRGYDDTNLLSVNMGSRYRISSLDTTRPKGHALLDLFKNDLKKVPSVVHVSANILGMIPIGVEELDDAGEVQDARGYLSSIDVDYLKTMGVKFVEGRDFNPDFGKREFDHWIVNESFSKSLLLRDSVDRVLGMSYGKGRIIGIVEDYSFWSPTNKVPALLIRLNKNRAISSLLVKFKPESFAATLNALENSWMKLNPDSPFDFSLIEESNDSQFAEEKRWQSIILTASLIAICISCLGLFGLAYIATQRRVKEIGIRKVFGAPVPAIVYILVRGFSVLILMSLLIAGPVAYYIGENWLERFPYRIEMTWDLFLIAVLMQLFIGLMTVSSRAIKAAMADPVKALKYE